LATSAVVPHWPTRGGQKSPKGRAVEVPKDPPRADQRTGGEGASARSRKRETDRGRRDERMDDVRRDREKDGAVPVRGRGRSESTRTILPEQKPSRRPRRRRRKGEMAGQDLREKKNQETWKGVGREEERKQKVRARSEGKERMSLYAVVGKAQRVVLGVRSRRRAGAARSLPARVVRQTRRRPEPKKRTCSTFVESRRKRGRLAARGKGQTRPRDKRNAKRRPTSFGQLAPSLIGKFLRWSSQVSVFQWGGFETPT